MFKCLKWGDSVKLGDISLKNRIIMSALTRTRTDPQTNIPTQLNALYYSQRSGAGLILTQATAVSQRGQGFYGAASLWNKYHAQGWKKVVQAVHKNKGVIFIQLCHAGRCSFPVLTNGLEPIGPSSIARRDKMHGLGNFLVPKEMSQEDIQITKQEYRQSLKLAKDVGFDGVQIHAASGYLLDSFIKSSSNKRTDCYGGSVENRARLLLEIIDIAIQVFGKGRIGIKVSPTSRAGDVFDENPIETFTYIVKELDKREIAFIEFREVRIGDPAVNLFGVQPLDQIEDIAKTFRPYFRGTLVNNCGFTPQSGIERINSGVADMISFGKLYITNPDLAERILNEHPVNTKWDPKVFYNHQLGAEGYTTYKTYQQQQN